MTHSSPSKTEQFKLEYPFGLRWSPEPGEPFEVADGVHWLRMPLPIALDHINLWLLRDGDGWVIVDSGYDDVACKDVWQQVFDTFIDSSKVTKIIITHFHPDHIGLASWLSLRCECPVLISKGEFDHYHGIITRDKAAFHKRAQEFVGEMGYDDDMASKFVQFMSSGDKPEEARVQPSMCEFIADGDNIEIDGRIWQVISGNGHSPEHSCLYNEQINVFISGDQSIPRISSNISVYPSNRHENPLKDWLDSCQKLQDLIANDTLVLPSHQEPFRNNKLRMQKIMDDHYADLDRLRAGINKPMSTVQARGVIFDRELNMVDILLATGETLAHLNYLLHNSELHMTKGDDGVALYAPI